MESSVIKATKINQFMESNVLPESFRATITDHYLPLAKHLLNEIGSYKGTFYLGINGCQGSGKSTLSEFLAWFFEEQKVNAVVLSLDDFYHDRSTRQTLSETVSPLLATRGVPGTHNTKSMANTLSALAEKRSVTIPRFNKAQDNPFPESNWSTVKAPLKIVIMEGWCWGVQPQTPLQLRYPVNALEAEQDPNLIWRKWINQQIQEHYVPLYQMMDYWVMLKAPSFDSVFKWRLEQEQKLADKIGTTKDTKLMSEAQIHEFIQFYQRLTEECINTLSDKCDVVFELNENRKIKSRVGL